MNWKELKKKHYPHFLSISIDRLVSKKVRNFFRKISAFAALVSFVFSFGDPPLYFGKADALFFLFADAYLVLFFIEVFYRSMSNQGIKARVGESLVGESLQLDHALSSVLYDTDEIDVSRVFFETEVGKKIFKHLGISDEKLGEFIYRNRVPIIASSLEIDLESVDLPKYAEAVYGADKELRNFLSENSKTREDFVSASGVVSVFWEEERRQERFWSREKLGAIPSIGSMFLLSSGKNFLKSKFVSKISLTGMDGEAMAHNSLDGASLLEEALEKDARANVLLVSDDLTLAYDTLKKLARKIELGSSLPSLEHRPLRRFEWKEFLDHAEKLGGKDFIGKSLASILEEMSRNAVILYIADLPGFLSRARDLGFNLPVSLLPYLSSEKLQIIASTSFADYKFFLETNPTLNQKFAKIELS